MNTGAIAPDPSFRSWLLDRLDQLPGLSPPDQLALLDVCSAALAQRATSWREALAAAAEPPPAPLALRERLQIEPAAPGSLPASRLAYYVREIEHLEEDKSSTALDIREFYTAAKGEGFDTKILRLVIAIRRKDPKEREAQEQLLELYMRELEAAGSQALSVKPGVALQQPSAAAANSSGNSSVVGSADLPRVEGIIESALSSDALSPWELDFCADMRVRLAEYGAGTFINDAQWEVIGRLEERA